MTFESCEKVHQKEIICLTKKNMLFCKAKALEVVLAQNILIYYELIS